MLGGVAKSRWIGSKFKRPCALLLACSKSTSKGGWAVSLKLLVNTDFEKEGVAAAAGRAVSWVNGGPLLELSWMPSALPSLTAGVWVGREAGTWARQERQPACNCPAPSNAHTSANRQLPPHPSGRPCQAQWADLR